MSEIRGDDTETVSELCARVEALHRTGRLRDAVAILEDSDIAASATGSDQLRILLAQGRLLTDQMFHADKGYEEAVAKLTAAMTLAARLDDALSSAMALDLLGMADYYRILQAGGSEYSVARERFEAALAQREELRDSRGVAESLFHSGLVHERLAQNDEALSMYRRSYELARERGHRLEQSYAARHLGFRAQETGDLDVALAYFRESLDLRQAVGYTLLLPLAHIALGDALLAQNEIDSAAREYEQAHTLADGMQSPLVMAHTLLSLSELAHARGDEGDRRDYAERALSSAQEDHVALGVRAAEAALAAIAQEHT